MAITAQQAAEVLAAAEQIYSAAEVEQALDRLALEITGKLSGEDPLILCVLNGALIPTGHLLTRLNFPLRHDYIHATRYRGKTSGAALEWIGRPSTTLAGETVLVVDDIFDEGVTLSAIVEACQTAGAKAVYSVVLVEKIRDRKVGFVPDFVGLTVEDRYVFGYGMDYMEYHRNLPGIYAVAKDR
ncbi:MAG: hypoxanthine-guanine phosphoribosyltransferase [gamma proteobacterium symbiont of Ctena orbiculata]|uniref:Hypoxanthine-guanine phosphoribosyltransferase n=1 Tax=Candidatus Thiodiazotropha taylori TaxID=2792791 RepID=A0A944MA35_9GAMM|nr:hypoxanthine-guanine phosphoribosyltransferase [Candidatus Thiodiazotropha taylori]PUB83881.1 MAG: hypoxanthine-guanine phosphoribosyltransferase [gamma proteobacterium symbiont of Ctena orbiculata]MBT3027524.1 hypoxanthine-guanine phosphoribosyltransferase [Candidatus Thiodiazotropha taylori]MBT3035013.1 hypoxanthine-guanine phosphoribosyltransferase [Candidatus Thiodiazotropha taylori]MBV2138623.1 hypoxanthine-guanine phosphoribosyltransferase [Candidatus Thiodiazotropha taylori]